MSRKLVSSQSLPCSTSQLDLFSVPPTSITIDKVKWLEVQLTNNISNDGPYSYHIAPDPMLLNLSKNFILMELRITKQDGSPFGANDLIAPINLLGKSFFKQVVLSLNNTEVYHSGNKYAHRAYLETHLNYCTDVKQNQLRVGGYFHDGVGANLNIDSNETSGFKTRAKVFKLSAWVELLAPIHTDMVSQDRYLVSNVDVRLTLERNSDKFLLLNFDQPTLEPKIEIRKMVWYCQTVSILPSVNLAIEKTTL